MPDTAIPLNNSFQAHRAQLHAGRFHRFAGGLVRNYAVYGAGQHALVLFAA